MTPEGKTAIRIRPMEEGDLDAAAEIEARSCTKPWSRKMLETELSGNLFARLIVAESPVRPGGPEGPGLAGHACFWIVFDELHIMTLAVDPAHRRRGVGEELARRVLVQGREAKVRLATLEVRASNTAAQHLYEKLDFRTTSVRKRYYREPEEDALIMLLKFEDHECGGIRMDQNGQRELVRQEKFEYRKLEAHHADLEAELETLVRKRALTPSDEIRKKQIQIEKLHAKDRMEEIVRSYRT